MLNSLESMFNVYLKFQALDELTKPIRNIQNEAVKTAKTFKSVENTVKSTQNKVSNSLSNTAKELEKTTKAVKDLSETSKKAIPDVIKLKVALNDLAKESKKLTDIGKKLTLIGSGIVGATTPFVYTAVEFQKGMAEISTLVDMSFNEFQEKYQSKLLEISRQLGQDTSDVVKAFYDAISSGFSPDEALGLITQAGKAAIAGVSDIATANDTLITVLNT